jgi:hypothetical protein
VDINKIFKYSWELFVKDIVPLIVGGLIASILGVVTLGILAGPLYGGLVKMIIRRIREKRPAEIGDVFSAMDQFGTLFITSLVLTILIILGLFLCIIPGILLATIWIYVFIFIVDKRMGMGEAMSASKDLVSRVGLGMHLVMILVFGVISGLLSLTYIGGIVVYPFILVVVSVMYFLFNGEEALLVGATGKEVVNLSAPSSFDTYSPKEVVISPVPPSVTPQPNPVASPAVERRSATAVCASCGNKVSTAGAFCTECGAPLKLVCSNCKKELASGARFCPGCGSKIEM